MSYIIACSVVLYLIFYSFFLMKVVRENGWLTEYLPNWVGTIFIFISIFFWWLILVFLIFGKIREVDDENP